MDYQELIMKAEKESEGFRAYWTNQGPETGFNGRYNLKYFERFGFRFRLIDSEPASTEVTLFGRKFATPIVSAAFSGMVEITDRPLTKIAMGVKESGSMMWVGIASPEQVKEVFETGVPTVRIVKPFQDIEAMVKELKEAEEGGAIAVGTDIAFFYGAKRGEIVFAPKAMAPKNSDELRMLAGVTKLPFILKGVLSAEDAKKALEIGAGAIVVSNHGGNIIDYAAHPLEVLQEIKGVIGDRMIIFADSGFRRGSDVMKALALGADAVLVGRALVAGLAADGSNGVTAMINILTAELQRIMSVTGCRKASDIDESVLVKRDIT
jgi:4-hydroxymandelate oxidase